METLDPAPLKKARTINLDPHFYGTFAEIGAGQEIARYFFTAGRASQTIAKTISAYDMTFSDSIYGKTGRYVCEDRVIRMLDHEFSLLVERLGAQRGGQTRFFALADTVATSSHSDPSAKCHGWMGIRFQTKPKGPTHDYILHVRMRDRSRLQQQEALGILGVNLVDLAHEIPKDRTELLERLMQNLSSDRIEINCLHVKGPDLSHFDNRLLNLEMVKLRIADAVIFEPDGKMANPSDFLFKKPALVQRGTFRPVTNVNVTLMEKGVEQFRSNLLKGTDPLVICEMTMNSLTNQGQVEEQDFLDRVDTLCALNYTVLLSNFDLFYQLKSFLRTYTDQPLAMIIGASFLEKIYLGEHYRTLPGGVLEGFSRLFDESTSLVVFPYKSDNLCQTAKTFHPPDNMNHLHQFLMSSGKIVDIADCDEVDTSIHSSDVREMLSSGDPAWESLVPAVVAKMIRSRKMFGAK